MNALLNFKSEGLYSLASKARQALTTYFSSGWMFFLPYLSLYLLFVVMRWQIRSVPGYANIGLVDVYRFLHVVHVSAGVCALGVWWRVNCRSRHELWIRLQNIAPWVLLAAIVVIPGVYLEIPSDPWSHLARVNAWNRMDVILDNPEWMKSSSFLAHSFVGRAAPDLQLMRFTVFYAVCCLLYYWQYYRLMRAIGLSAPLSFMAVLANLLLFGNSVFGFHRYYGMATTIIAHIGVLALTRLLLESLPHLFTSRDSATPDGTCKNTPPWLTAVCVVLLMSLIALNHVQGIALAIINGLAIIVWLLTRGSRVRWFLLFGSITVASLLVILLWPRHAMLDAVYRPAGLLAPWYGFNLLAPSSPAFALMLQILGIAGLLNLAAGIWLIYRGQLSGWLIVTPLLCLLSPAVAIPFADAVVRFGPPGYEYIITFPRLLLGIPAGLALCVFAAELLAWLRLRLENESRHAFVRFATLVGALMLLITLPPTAPFYNRTWHVLMQVPSDLRERHLTDPRLYSALTPPQGEHRSSGGPDVLSTPGVGFVLDAFGVRRVTFRNKWMVYPTMTTPVRRVNAVQLAVKQLIPQKQRIAVVVPTFASLFTPFSQAGFTSGHWPANQAALEQAGTPELEQEVAPYLSLISEHSKVRIFGGH